MKRLHLPLLLLVFALLCWGCPDDFDHPLAPPKMKMDQRILGSWINEGDLYEVEPASDATVKIFANNGELSEDFMKELEMVSDSLADFAPDSVKDEQDPEEGSRKPTYLAHLSMLKGKTMLNVRKVSDGKWHIFLFGIDNGRAALFPATNPYREYHSSHKEVKAYFKRQMDEDHFFADPLRFVRKPSADASR